MLKEYFKRKISILVLALFISVAFFLPQRAQLAQYHLSPVSMFEIYDLNAFKQKIMANNVSFENKAELMFRLQNIVPRVKILEILTHLQSQYSGQYPQFISKLIEMLEADLSSSMLWVTVYANTNKINLRPVFHKIKQALRIIPKDQKSNYGRYSIKDNLKRLIGVSYKGHGWLGVVAVDSKRNIFSSTRGSATSGESVVESHNKYHVSYTWLVDFEKLDPIMEEMLVPGFNSFVNNCIDRVDRTLNIAGIDHPSFKDKIVKRSYEHNLRMWLEGLVAQDKMLYQLNQAA